MSEVPGRSPSVLGKRGENLAKLAAPLATKKKAPKIDADAKAFLPWLDANAGPELKLKNPALAPGLVAAVTKKLGRPDDGDRRLVVRGGDAHAGRAHAALAELLLKPDSMRLGTAMGLLRAVHEKRVSGFGAAAAKVLAAAKKDEHPKKPLVAWLAAATFE